MRFLLKIAFLLGLVALFLPSGRDADDPAGPGMSPIVLFYGAQQAISDFGGFCDRAPAACASGQEAMRFAGERLGDGIALAYSFASGRIAPAGDPVSAATRSHASAAQPIVPRTDAQPTRTSPSLQRPAGAPSASPIPVKPNTDPVTTAAVERGPVPGSPKPFRMPAMAGGARPLRMPHPAAAVPPAAPARLPLPQAAPRA